MIENSLELPLAAPGEGTRWRLEAMPYITHSWKVDRWIVGLLVLLSVAYVAAIYTRERVGQSHSPHAARFDRRIAPAMLRSQLLLIMLLIVLPQTQLVVEREAWPDVVIILDDSKSMSSLETFTDPLLRDKSEELKATWEKLAQPRIVAANKRIFELRRKLSGAPTAAGAARWRDEILSLEKHVNDWRIPHRLNLIKALLASSSRDWLQALLNERKLHVHLYRAANEATPIADLSDPEQTSQFLDAIFDIVPEGEGSRLGEALASVLKSFRGRSLNAIVMFTDGQNTSGDEPSQVAAFARRKSVPLFLVGVGDATPRPDIALSDLRAEHEVNVRDRLIFDVRISSQGAGMPDAVPVNLYEMIDGKPIRRDSRLAPISDKPVRLSYVADTPGDKLFVVEVPLQEGETDRSNNRIEHEVHVSEAKRIRLLLIEDVPRYDFRFVKSLFERESEQIGGIKTVDLNVLLLGASKEYYKEDKNVLAQFPGWEELKSYDAIVLGDVSPKQLAPGLAPLKLLRDFVRERGGGLLFMAGEHFSPSAYADSELADILPVLLDKQPLATEGRLSDRSLTATYQPQLTAMGVNHPIFRFTAEDAENAALWSRLQGMRWFATGYRRKPAAEVLAVHPEFRSSGLGNELHPLILQQFVGAGRVLFFGFDETWRWRFRRDEQRFNQFWMQTIRWLARNRLGRIEVSVPANTFRRDDSIRVTVQFPDDAPPPSSEERIEINVERRPLRRPGQNSVPDTVETEKVQLTLKEKTRAVYETLLPRVGEGAYRFVLANPAVSGRAKGGGDGAPSEGRNGRYPVERCGFAEGGD